MKSEKAAEAATSCAASKGVWRTGVLIGDTAGKRKFHGRTAAG
jgi:hypothetical protein